MQKKLINPWNWQTARNYEQAVEIVAPQRTLYLSGQAAIDDNGNSSTAGMEIQLATAIQNVEHVLRQAHYPVHSIVKITVYTVSLHELSSHFQLLQNWIKHHQIETALTVVEVKGLFETLKVELDVIAVQ